MDNALSAGHYGKISPARTNRTSTCSGGILFHTEGNYFSPNDWRTIHYPAYYTAIYKKDNLQTNVFCSQFVASADKQMNTSWLHLELETFFRMQLITCFHFHFQWISIMINECLSSLYLPLTTAIIQKNECWEGPFKIERNIHPQHSGEP